MFNASFRSGLLLKNKGVITSYSIHYTKLYEGDARKSNGGRGGHPLTYDPARMFFGGGGGAGDQDSGQGGAGGKGGGIVFLTVYGNTTGSGTISANSYNFV